jgi:formylglycine-generating enzyme required for sulfatase activity
MAELVIAATLAPLLVAALKEVADEVVVKPLLGPATEQFKSWVDARVDDIKVRQAVEAAAQAAGQWEGLDERYWLKSALHRLAEPGRAALRKSTVAAALAMTDDAAEEVPVELLRALDVLEEHRADLAHFLWAFRNGLVKDDDDAHIRAMLEAIQGRLKDVAAGVEILASTVVETHAGPSVQMRAVPPDEREIERRYLDSFVRGFSRLSLTGRDPRDSDPDTQQLRLQNVYIALNTIPRERHPGREGETAAEMVEQAEKKPPSALRALLDHSYLLLLGEPGSGKTTFARHLALCLAGERAEPGAGWVDQLQTHDAAWKSPALLPIWVRLRHFAADSTCLPADCAECGQAEHLLKYIEQDLQAGHHGQALPEHALARLLDRGDALLVLDGLDEVGDPDRRVQVAQAINDLAGRRRPPSRLLVTCRVRQYRLDDAGRPRARWALPCFPVATLTDFDDEQIACFIEAWFGELCAVGRRDEDTCAQKVVSLKEAIGERPDLQQIAPRPILLTQMALVHDIKEKLPDSRVKLYQECADLLLWQWENLRTEPSGRAMAVEGFIRDEMQTPGLTQDDIQAALDHAVYDAHAGQGQASEAAADIPRGTLCEHLRDCIMRTGLGKDEAEAKVRVFVDRYLGRHNGLIVPAGEDTFQTPHRTLQEFMAARWLANGRTRYFTAEAPELVRTDYDLWREVFVLAVGQASLNLAVDAVGRLCPDEWPRDEAGWQRVILSGEGLREIGLPKARADEEGPRVAELVLAFLQRTAQDTDERGQPYKRPRVPIPTRYGAAETLDRLNWLPDDLDAFIWIPSPSPASRERGPGGEGFYIAKYPVTNVQFARFIEDGGYENHAYWGGEESPAWRWRVKEHNVEWRGKDPVTQPEYWNHPRFGKSRHGYPVVGVSWYEANAYCEWLEGQVADGKLALSKVEGLQIRLVGGSSDVQSPISNLHFRLPTDEEWVAAAGGEQEGEKERYPWGPQWDGSRANTYESGIGGTSPVGMYPSGKSVPHGIWDMGGNVWEWLASEYADGVPALRGGSWLGDQSFARVVVRLRGDPDDSDYSVGFRVVASPAGA